MRTSRTWSQRGMGLVEVMVATAMLGGLTLVVMQMNESGQKGVTRVEKSLEVAEIDVEINSFLADRENCTATLTGAGLTNIAAVTGTATFPVAAPRRLIIRDAGSVERYAHPFMRNLVSLDEVYITGFGDLSLVPGSARLIKKYSFKLSSNITSTKTKSATIFLTQDPAPPNNITGCVLRAAEVDTIWSVDANGISYQTNTVAIGKNADVLVPYALDVLGQVVTGNDNAISGALPDAGNSIIGGALNTISGALVADSAILSGRSNIIATGSFSVIVGGGGANPADANYINANNAAILGGTANQVSGNSAVVVGGMLGSAAGLYSAVVGGYWSQAWGPQSAVLGGTDNNATVDAVNAIVAGGNFNMVHQPSGSIVGGEYNAVSPGSGAESSSILGGSYNRISGTSGAIIAGDTNTASGVRSTIVGSSSSSSSGESSIVLGGGQNTVISSASGMLGGFNNYLAGQGSVILGGLNNSVTSTRGAIIGGEQNTASGSHAVVLGGSSNNVGAATLNAATVAGSSNTVLGSNAVILGGTNNVSSAIRSAVMGGNANTASMPDAVVLGGSGSSASATRSGVLVSLSSQASALGSTILGGESHTVSGANSVVLGGFGHTVSSVRGAILSGESNTVGGTNSAIIGGTNNSIPNATLSVILGGSTNTISGIDRGGIIGGVFNRVSGNDSVILGGGTNTITTAISAILGSSGSTASGVRSIVIGGDNSRAEGSRSIAIGMGVTARGNNTVGISGLGTLVTPTTAGRLVAKFNEYIFYTNVAETTGYRLQGAANWTSVSSTRASKTDFREVDHEEILSKMPDLELPTWVYKDQDDKTTRVLGPIAENFHELFVTPYSLTSPKNSISSTDIDGVLLASVKALEKRTRDLREENDSLKKEVHELRLLYHELIQKMDTQHKTGR